jgi:hypothetical protein
MEIGEEERETRTWRAQGSGRTNGREVSQLGERAEQFPDVRKGDNRQREMHVHQGRDNAKGLFGVGGIPSDNEIRNLLDPVAPRYVSELYWKTLRALESQGLLAEYRGAP